MSEENLNNQEVAPAAENAAVQATTAASAETPASEMPAAPEAQAAPAADATPAKPQVVVQKERGFSHYVGFALLCVLCICFFFAPGIAVTFGVSRVVDLNPAAAWMFSAILSAIVWLIFKLKIKGFKKSFYFYIGLCVLVVAALIVAEVLTEQTGVFANIFAMLIGASA